MERPKFLASYASVEIGSTLVVLCDHDFHNRALSIVTQNRVVK